MRNHGEPEEGMDNQNGEDFGSQSRKSNWAETNSQQLVSSVMNVPWYTLLHQHGSAVNGQIRLSLERLKEELVKGIGAHVQKSLRVTEITKSHQQGDRKGDDVKREGEWPLVEEHTDTVPRAPPDAEQRDEHIQHTAEENAALQLLSDRLAHNDEVQGLRVRDDARSHHVDHDENAHRNVEHAHLRPEGVGVTVADPHPGVQTQKQRLPNTIAVSHHAHLKALQYEEHNARRDWIQPSQYLVSPVL